MGRTTPTGDPLELGCGRCKDRGEVGLAVSKELGKREEDGIRARGET